MAVEFVDTIRDKQWEEVIKTATTFPNNLTRTFQVNPFPATEEGNLLQTFLLPIILGIVITYADDTAIWVLANCFPTGSTRKG